MYLSGTYNVRVAVGGTSLRSIRSCAVAVTSPWKAAAAIVGTSSTLTDQAIPEKESDRPTGGIDRKIVDAAGMSHSQDFIQEPDLTRRNARLWDVLRELERLIAEGGDIPEHQVEQLEGRARRARGQ